MPTATLTFTLPEEQHEHHLVLHAGALLSVLKEMQEAYRRTRKYESAAPTEEFFYATLEDHGVNLDEFE